MIYEHARLATVPGRGPQFEGAFTSAGRDALSAATGCRSVQLLRSAEGPDVYLLVVGWDSIGDHLERFPSTPQAEQLTAAIGEFFVGEPAVEHFEAEPVA